MTVLYIEENKTIADYFHNIFSSNGVTFYHINDISQIESYYSRLVSNSDIVIANTTLNEKDMMSYTKYLNRKYNMTIPIIAYSDQDLVANATRAKQSGIDNFIALPALPFEVISIIHEIGKNHSNILQDVFLNKGNDNNENKGIAKIFRQYVDQYFKSHTNIKPSSGLYDRIMQEIEPEIILSCLDYTNGNKIKAADILGINRNTLRKKMSLYSIE